jgi:superfamily I DNA/RNA helicase
MDAVELARRAAARLHEQAVARGLDPWAPFAFAVAEARRRDLDIEATSPGAAVLDGGRAAFIAADRLILYENAGTQFDQALLIAHELGHVELGDDPDGLLARDIDFARSAEPSPVGVDRVVDYGRRQRREVQMDLFAREFLLPRSGARRLHVDEGLTATAIAERLGAPFDIVAQQLFDALLLPPVPLPAEAERIERALNPEQQAAAGHRGGAYLLEAGPGTGKTQTLAARVERLLADGLDPRRILVLTFSNKAAREMAERIALSDAKAAAAMWIGTFHAFGLDLIRRFHIELGLPKDPRLMDRTEAVELLEAEFLRLALTHYRNLYDPTQIIADILAAISRAKDEVVDAEHYARLCADMRARAKTPEVIEAAERAEEVAKVYTRYEQLKRDANCVDFGDLISLPVQLLEGSPEISAHLQDQYDHVLVDEYQDVNRSSVRMLVALRGDGKNLWVVGDVKQSIYRFRGASSFNMRRFGKEDFAGGTRNRLKRNYRSHQEIVTAFSAFAADMKAADGESGLAAERGAAGHAPEHRAVDQVDHQTVALADAIEEMRAAGYSYDDQAVLCTGNERLSKLGQDLERLGVPVLFLGSLFERAEVKDLLSLLSVLTDRRAMGLVRVACSSDFAMTLGDVAAVLEHLRPADGKPVTWLGDLDAIAGISPEGHAALRRLATALEGFAPNAAPWTVLATLLLDRTRTVARVAVSRDLVDRGRGIALWQFLNFVRVQPAGQGLPITRLLDRVRRLVRLADERDLRQLPASAQGIDAVRLMTIHGAKGLEFPVVHVPGMNADTLPRASQPQPCPPPDGMIEGGKGSALEIFRAGHDEEQECLFYVALSRARDRLFLYSPTQKSNGHARPESRFLGRMGPGLLRRRVAPDRALPTTSEDEAIQLIVQGKLIFGAAQIALYESCPRRFFYTHLLRVGGRRTVTPFMRMHEAVRTVFQAIVADAGPITDDRDIEKRVVEACAAQGLADDSYVADFHALALTMLRYFLGTRRGLRAETPTALRLVFGEEEIIVRPDDMLVGPDGRHVLRRVQTGHRRSRADEDVGAAAFLLAARQAFPGAVVELVHLSDQETLQIDLKPKALETRRGKLTGFLAEIRAGSFPARPSTWTCPGCPAFFICGPVPAGALQKKFDPALPVPPGRVD